MEKNYIMDSKLHSWKLFSCFKKILILPAKLITN